MRRLLVAAAAGAALAGAAAPVVADATRDTVVPVALVQAEDGWSLTRAGRPYVISGAGGDADLDALAAAGANSIRTWGADDIGALLDAAHARGLTVAVGVWLGHERHGFDYGDPEQVAGQLERVRETVLRYRDHPAVLLWALGNEMEGFEAGDDERIWAAVNEAAKLVKSLDSHHPTMTVTAEIGGERVRYVHEYCTAIDIHGINSYGGVVSLPERLRAAGAKKPYIVTEYGPPGSWEVARTPWGAPLEPTSTVKAAMYAEASERIAADPLSLGSYAFTWGAKMEATETWFGMFLHDGTALGAVDSLTERWSGQRPGNRAPTLSPIEIAGETTGDGGDEFSVEVDAADPDGDPLRFEWVLLPEAADEMTGGDFRARPVPVDGAIAAADGARARVRLPDEPGAYRLFVFARDRRGKGATANVPLRVRGEVRTRLPVYVYEDAFAGMRWAPSGWMGNIDGLTLADDDASQPHTGEHALRLRYEGPSGWAAVAWQHPPNDWGDREGGFDLTGARALEVWARGAYGGEQVSFGVGLIGNDKPFPDSTVRRIEDIMLTDTWRRYEVPLRGEDLTTVKTGFVVSVIGRRTPVTIYLDRIRFVR